MKLGKRTVSMTAALMTVGLVASCGKKKGKEETATAGSMADLGLSSALMLEIPDTMAAAAGGSTALNLTGKKSSEACRTMENTNRVMDNLKEIGGMFCHLEAESAKMKFGTKYNVSMTGGGPQLNGESMAIWVDNSNAAELKVYMCQGGSLKQQIIVSGFGGEGKAKGSLNSKHSGSESQSGSTFSGGINLDFDFTQAGYKIVNAKMAHSQTGGSHAGSFRNASEISLADAGVSVVKMSSSGNRGTDTMSDQGAVMFNGTMGQALFTGNGTYEGNGYDWTQRSTFGSDGITVANSTATADIKIDKATLPAKLDASFSPTDPSGWDCSGATETITIDMTDTSTKAAHDACETDHSKSFTQCWGPEFDQGERE